MAKRGRGRPPLSASVRRSVLASVKKHGITRGLKDLADNKGITVSLSYAIKVAREEGLSFPRGRRVA